MEIVQGRNSRGTLVKQGPPPNSFRKRGGFQDGAKSRREMRRNERGEYEKEATMSSFKNIHLHSGYFFGNCLSCMKFSLKRDMSEGFLYFYEKLCGFLDYKES
ncbi:hypothetical protein CEXT_458251 [Caerostris extrusa]|uniref:Uncharacterized protein n=1 Tax=Caerostris extrusa TaxID=172846 RepID=A0AAV4YBT7_CAEEX|nr:hypothetical protein CEXT_458251 [Caerostris extrusa]